MRSQMVTSHSLQSTRSKAREEVFRQSLTIRVKYFEESIFQVLTVKGI